MVKQHKKKAKEAVMLAEHILEVRHEASGSFLDFRGHIADQVRGQGFLPHWQIDTNVVNFRDGAQAIESEGAFIGFKSVGHVLLNPGTRNHFPDRATAFWKIASSIPDYNLPALRRFGARTKLFVPCPLTFEELRERMYRTLFTEELRSSIGGAAADLQFTIEIKGARFDARIVCGPLHKEEGGRHFQFKAMEFEKCGLYLDLDYYRTTGLAHTDVPKLLHEAMALEWEKAERIALALGL